MRALLPLLLYVPCISSSESTVCRCHHSSSVAEAFECASQTAAYEEIDEVSNSLSSIKSLEKFVFQLHQSFNETKFQIENVEPDVKQLKQDFNEERNRSSKLEQTVEELDKKLNETKHENREQEKRLRKLEKALSTIRNSAMSIDFWLKANRKDCNDVMEQGFTSNGVYDITVNEKMVSVFCDMTTDDGGWMTIQRQIDGTQDFSLSWEEYVEGFGDLNEEFWIGLETLHSITTSGSYQLRVDLEDLEDRRTYALYRSNCYSYIQPKSCFSRFSVGDSVSNYRLEVSGYSGTAGDAMSYYNNQPFSTRDRDNDANANINCAEFHGGGWWYSYCPNSNLNGMYPRGSPIDHTKFGWYNWNNKWCPMKRAEMKIRRS